MNVTVSGNSAGEPATGGLFIDDDGNAEVRFSTFVNNSVTGNDSTGAITNQGQLQIGDSIIGPGNTGGEEVCFGVAGASTGNNFDAGNDCGFTQPTDHSNTDPMLGPLADNGGLVQTHALLAGSPAIDAAGNCPPPDTDARGVARPIGAACDSGAFEMGPVDTPTPTPGPGQTVIWGNNNCSGPGDPPDPIDSLLTLRFDAGLSTNTGDCPGMGVVVEVQNASPHPWGDIDCGGDVNPIDSLKLLRFDGGLSVAQEPSCPVVGSEVEVT